MQSRKRFRPDANEAFAADFGRQRRIEDGFSAHMVAMEASDDMPPVADAKRVGQRAQLAAGDPAFDAVAVILQKAQEAWVLTLDVIRLMHGHLHMAAPPEEAAQGRVGLAAAEREHREIRIEQRQRRVRQGNAGSEVALELGPGGETVFCVVAHCNSFQGSSSQPS